MSFRSRVLSCYGMGVADHSKYAFLELKRKKVYRYVIFKIDEKTNEIVVEKTGGPAENYNDFAESLPVNDCRYAVYDFDFVTYDNCQKSKIFFIAWCPAVSQIRTKMLYAMSKHKFKRELDGVHYEIQATDPTEMDLQVIRERLEALQFLTHLNLSNNKICSFLALDPIRMLKELKVLDISYNEIGAHAIDTRRYLCSSPLTNTVGNDLDFDKFANGDIKSHDHWDVFLIFKGLNLIRLDIMGNAVVDNHLKAFITELLLRLKWLDGDNCV